MRRNILAAVLAAGPSCAAQARDALGFVCDFPNVASVMVKGGRVVLTTDTEKVNLLHIIITGNKSFIEGETATLLNANEDALTLSANSTLFGGAVSVTDIVTVFLSQRRGDGSLLGVEYRSLASKGNSMSSTMAGGCKMSASE